MARKLEKIEKEMGYCEIKLEKEKRFRKQIEFLGADVTALEELIRILKPHDALLEREVNREVHERPTRETFLAAGLLDLIREKRDLYLRERADLITKLEHYVGFEKKKKILEDEKKESLRKLNSTRSAKLRRLNDEFKKTERVWNELTEDLINLEEGIFFVERNLDYLRSGRNFLITAKGNHDVEDWQRDGYLTDLFRHSAIGRAREMADGADRNIQAAQKELVCVSNFRLRGESFIRVLIPFMDALFEDLFVSGRINLTVQVIEAALAGNLKLLGQLKARKETMSAKLEQTEKVRGQLFQRMGAGRRSELTA